MMGGAVATEDRGVAVEAFAGDAPAPAAVSDGRLSGVEAIRLSPVVQPG